MSATNNTEFFGHIYALSMNPNTKLADWVAYEVDSTNFGVSPGRDWNNNPALSPDMTLEPDDYKGASSSNLQSDRGHQAPLATFAGSKYWYEANYLSNITPQDRDLNQGPWKALEDSVRNAVSFRDSLWVITGPTFENSELKLPGADEPHSVPSAYYKVVYDIKGHGAAFMLPQTISRKDNFCDFQISMSDLPIEALNITSDSQIAQRLGC
ncbi:DNA/RNA non-specific endonuclease [Reinekea marinisedimentorum]|uniref:DNA/RNA non-specific endonuclease n=1 Tax=Reinekea marinisedimentorum TaxID=230495 RepID=UPI0010540EC0|nr:DNA/RNA non-specific endonuclease [Reinekea marinisedimentorum]